MITYLDYQMAGIEYEDWPQEAKDNLWEKNWLDREDRYYRDHPEED